MQTRPHYHAALLPGLQMAEIHTQDEAVVGNEDIGLRAALQQCDISDAADGEEQAAVEDGGGQGVGDGVAEHGAHHAGIGDVTAHRLLHFSTEGRYDNARKRAVAHACNLQHQVAIHLISEAESADNGTAWVLLHERPQKAWDIAGISVGEQKDVDLCEMLQKHNRGRGCTQCRRNTK